MNDKFNMVYLNNDADPSTFNATSAQLDIPPGSDVRWAGLYWGGNVTQGVNGQAAPNSGIRALCDFLAEAPNSPVRKYTPTGNVG